MLANNLSNKELLRVDSDDPLVIALQKRLQEQMDRCEAAKYGYDCIFCDEVKAVFSEKIIKLNGKIKEYESKGLQVNA